jgi:hypothetical protein
MSLVKTLMTTSGKETDSLGENTRAVPKRLLLLLHLMTGGAVWHGAVSGPAKNRKLPRYQNQSHLPCLILPSKEG